MHNPTPVVGVLCIDPIRSNEAAFSHTSHHEGVVLTLDQESRADVVSIIVNANFVQADEPIFEALLRPPRSYLEGLKEQVEKHPVRYIQEHAKDRVNRGKPLEGSTHIDCNFLKVVGQFRPVRPFVIRYPRYTNIHPVGKASR